MKIIEAGFILFDPDEPGMAGISDGDLLEVREDRYPDLVVRGKAKAERRPKSLPETVQ